jgi:hypothetical protein
LQLQQMVVETVADLGAFIADHNRESILMTDQTRRKGRGRKSPPLKSKGGAPSVFLSVAYGRDGKLPTPSAL